MNVWLRHAVLLLRTPMDSQWFSASRVLGSHRLLAISGSDNSSELKFRACCKRVYRWFGRNHAHRLNPGFRRLFRLPCRWVPSNSLICNGLGTWLICNGLGPWLRIALAWDTYCIGVGYRGFWLCAWKKPHRSRALTQLFLFVTIQSKLNCNAT
jgi:hypothetical protein